MSDIRYAQAEDGTHVAYRVLDATGDHAASHDIVMVSGALIPIELFDEEPGFVRLLQGLQSFGRVVIFDRRGIGLSDPITDWERPVLDQWADDVEAVVDAAVAGQAVVFGWDGYGLGARFAAQRPEKVRALAMYQPLIGSQAQWEAWSTARIEDIRANLGGAIDIMEQLAPSRASDRSFRAWYERAGRAGASPATAGRIWESVFFTPADDQPLARVQAPTLVLHRPANPYGPAEAAHWVEEQIPDATRVELDGNDIWPFLGDVDSLVGEIASFVVGERRLPPPQRVLSAVMFTDLVDSTKRAAALGDASWKAVLDRHDAAMRVLVGKSGGTVVKTTGDGILATFPSAGVAVRAGARLRDELSDDLEVRVGIHVGDVDRRGDDVSGLAVNTAARVMSAAGGGEVVVSASVVAAMAGEAATFDPLGPHELKGIPGVWELFRLER